MKRALLILALCFVTTYPASAQITTNEVLKAIGYGNTPIVKQYLDEGGNPNARGMGNVPLLISAVSVGNMDSVKMLAEKGANVNEVFLNMTPLCYAATTGNIDMAKLLIELGADVNFSQNGISPVSVAQSMGNMEMATFLNSCKRKSTVNPSITSKTILSTLTSADIIKAEEEWQKGKRLSYDLYEKGKSFWSLDFRMPLCLKLVTPYSQYRHEVYKEKQTFVPFTQKKKEAILSDKQHVYILPFSYGSLEYAPTLIKNMVIKKNGKIYQADFLPAPYLSIYQGYTGSYAFDIDLFDGEPMEIIAIDASTDEQLVMPINKKFYEKRGWY